MDVKRRMRPLLGTFVEIGVAADTDGADRAIDRAFQAVELIQSLMSFHDPSSELSCLNRSVGKELVLHPHTANVLRLALKLAHTSGELFNCTVGGSLVKQGILPDHGGECLDVGSSDDIRLVGHRAILLRPLRITLDGIAKGYAVDSAVRALQQCGVRGGWVNAGGDLRVFGDMTLPVSRRESGGTLAPTGCLNNSAMATSVVQAESTSSFPGWIVSSSDHHPQLGSWSVKAPSAFLADALTKIAALTSTDTQRRQTVSALGGELMVLP